MLSVQRDYSEQWCAAFDQQVQNLVRAGYPTHLGINTAAFVEQIAPLKHRMAELATCPYQSGSGHLPFAIVLQTGLIPDEQLLPLVSYNGKTGIVSMDPVAPGDFTPIAGVAIPQSSAYLLVDIDRGQATLNVTPDAALAHLTQAQRTPLTITEGIAILLHEPTFLQKNHGFSLLASRAQDRRVPALWLSAMRPKLGWCWAGNPHTWLGSASCGLRVGS